VSGQDQALTDTTAVAAVVVSYNSAATLAACLTSLRMQPELAEIRVIDNGSRDGSMALLEALRTEEPRLRLLRLPGNPGFAAACNLGAAAGGRRGRAAGRAPRPAVRCRG